MGGDFPLVNQTSTSYGAIYSLAVTKKYIIVGKNEEYMILLPEFQLQL